MNPILSNWLGVAETDLRSAITLERESLFETACYHCQQAVEKYLKAYLIYVRIEPPRTHDLTRLISIAQTVDSTFGALAEAATSLSDYATLYRYPTDVPVACSQEDAQEAIDMAQQVSAFVLARLEASLTQENFPSSTLCVTFDKHTSPCQTLESYTKSSF